MSTVCGHLRIVMIYQFSMKLLPFLTYVWSLFTLSTVWKFSSAIDFLSASTSISYGQTLISPGGRFELGFFSPGRSKSKYLGIWYKSTPDVFVWIANRNDPVLDSQDGVLFLNRNGSLSVLDRSSIVYWAANVSRLVFRPLLRLLDSGNLVLFDEAGQDFGLNYVWQSFDYPTDTRLPGMQLGLNLETGRTQHLTAWKSADDPSVGTFSYGLENIGLSQLVLRRGNQKRWRTGPWNGITFNGLVLLGRYCRLPLTVIQGSDGALAGSISDPYNSSEFSRIVLKETGVLQRYTLDVKTKVWRLGYTIPELQCESYGICGPNSICNSEGSPLCKCLNGFTEKSQEESGKGVQFSGCSRNMTTDHCKKGDTFITYPGVKFPDLLSFELKTHMSRSQCEAECLRNCSCTAYADAFVTSGDAGCLMWYGDLVDIVEFPQQNNEQDIYIRVTISTIEKTNNVKYEKNKGRAKIIWITTTSASVMALLFVGCISMKMNSKRKKMERMKEKELDLPIFEFATVAQATNNFSKENKIGEGGFGPVYKGKLSEQEVAVKRLSKTSAQGIEEFKNEVMFIAKLQHRNLVRLLGCCIYGEERMLIYEYLQNNSLHKFIFSPEKHASLTWQKRFEIMKGIARGLVYLHQDSRLKIIHRDLKASNILLDNDLVPKFSDFGLARLFDGDQLFAITRRIVGTCGYMAPEYAMNGHFSEKSDVFSMGVLLLEILSGKKNRNFFHADHCHNLLEHAWLLWEENRAIELMDERLKDSFVDYSQVKRCIQVGLLCVQKLAGDRPSMPSVLSMLGHQCASLPNPKQPGFFIERSIPTQNINESGTDDSNYTNSMITQIEAR